ncbi:molecular chaperone DnaJ [Bradyrhizobium barranii subsp. apii]|uniref:Molecular chaperone DnaJ n=1 Tax=Bradyrhizobium barranii subsp. apii TaxID=2819348 RepID=A0A8T5VLK8_9BRAD|nr:J domain-containing protein [Bradyrhizobium barranii]UPT88514.1 molecular chaperone DnaJ [Bradyrhizobium barranii subsp. apii]
MAGMRLKAETGNDRGGFWTILIGVFMSMGFSGQLLTWLGYSIPAADNMAVRVAVFALFVALSYAAFLAAVLVFARLLTLTFASIEWFVRLAISALETLLTAAVDHGRTALKSALALPLLPVRIAASWLHARYLAPFLEQRRQRAELRRLYEEVRGDYASFEEFLRAFHGGGKADAKDETMREEEERKPEPVDKFEFACRTLGLSSDALTQAQLKARFLELMKAVHPDVIGPNVFATQINEAREIIRARKGWK